MELWSRLYVIGLRATVTPDRYALELLDYPFKKLRSALTGFPDEAGPVGRVHRRSGSLGAPGWHGSDVDLRQRASKFANERTFIRWVHMAVILVILREHGLRLRRRGRAIDFAGGALLVLLRATGACSASARPF